MASLIEFGEGFACLLGWSGVAIIEVVNAAFEERVYREEFDDTEGARPTVRMSMRPSS